MREVWLYFEGDPALRAGFHVFFRDLVTMARDRRIRFRMVAGEADPVSDFARGMRQAPAATHILLIDSEGPDGGDPVGALRRRGDADCLAGLAVAADQVFLMVQVMEAWFLADRSTLTEFYGEGFLPGRLPSGARIEDIPKPDVLHGLHDATKGSIKQAYHKTRHAPDLLQRVAVPQVRRQAANCDRIFSVLGRLLDEA